MTKIYYTENNKSSFERAVGISTREGFPLDYLKPGGQWLTYFKGIKGENCFSDCYGIPENSVFLDYNDFFSVVAASLVKDKLSSKNMIYYTNNSHENYLKVLALTEKTGRKFDYVSYHRYLITNGEQLQSCDYSSGYKYLEPEEFFRMIAPKKKKPLYASFDERIAKYLGITYKNKWPHIFLRADGTTGLMQLTVPKEIVSHGAFIDEWVARNEKKEKTLDFKICGFNPVLTEKEIRIGCQTIPLEVFEKVAAAIKKPEFVHEEGRYCTDYSKPFLEYLKTIKQERDRGYMNGAQIYLNKFQWGVGSNLDNFYKKISHSEFLEKFSAPPVRKLIAITNGPNSILIDDSGILYGENYRVSFEEFAALETAVKNYDNK